MYRGEKNHKLIRCFKKKGKEDEDGQIKMQQKGM